MPTSESVFAAAQWEQQQQKGETRQAFAAFTCYRDMKPHERSGSKVAATLGKSEQLIWRWSSRWSWVERAQAWDAELDRVARAAQQEAVAEMNARHASIGMLMLSKALAKLVGDEALKVEALDPSTLTPYQVARLVEAGQKVERLARGEATEKQELVGEGGGPVQIRPVDYREAIAPVLSKDDDSDDE